MKSLDARNYEWQQLEGLRAILDFANGRKRLDNEVHLTNVRDATGYHDRPMWGPLAESLDMADETVVFDDGILMVLCTVRVWGGTMASHDDIEVRYYKLTPKARKP